MKAYEEAHLKRFCQVVLEGIGMNRENAHVVADSLINANLEGVDSHGISRLPIYVKRFMDQRITLNPHVQMVKKSPSVLLVDGDHGLGHISSYRAILEGMKMAKKSGVTAVAIKNSNHFGTASYFCQLACRHSMALMGCTNSPSGIAPWGGKKAFFGTNPIAFGFPTGNGRPVIIDLSTSIVARGKIILAAKQKKTIPDGWAIDENGQPTNDPEAALRGAVLPLGGAKGAALAMAVEILTGILSGAAFGPHVKNIYDDLETEKANVGHFFMVVDIEQFLDLQTFFESINRFLEEMKATPKIPGFEDIRYPGERRKREKEVRLAAGIPLSLSVEEELKKMANQFHISFPAPISLQKQI